MKMEEMEDKYIDLLLETCIDLNHKILFISYQKEIEQFIKKLVTKAKAKGISEFYLEMENIFYTHQFLKTKSEEEIMASNYFDKSIWDVFAKKKANFLIFETEYPKLMDDISDNLIAKVAKKKNDTRPLYRKMVEKCAISWCIAAYPGKMWAEAIYKENNSYLKLKEAIYKMCMLDKENPLRSWKEHLSKLQRIIKILNRLNLEKLHYSNSLGTELDVYLPKKYRFSSAKDGNVIVNMPSYEVFASPIYNKTTGIVYSSKPLNYNGKIVDQFWIKFIDGKAVDYDAKEGKKILKSVIENDKNSCYLGECALVEYNSPISLMNKTFGTTLIDENASCHLALGTGFAECLEDGLNLEPQELLNSGINVSKTHVDFMIGTSDLFIVGTTITGEEIIIFKNGNFDENLLENRSLFQ